MSGTMYPVGPQQLKIPTTTLHPSAASPFNASLINIPNEVNWNAIKALEDRGLYKTTFDACRPPYPAGGSFVNAGTYKLGGTLDVDGTVVLTGTTEAEFDTDRGYRQPVHITYIDSGFWGLDVTIPAAWPHTVAQTNATNPSNYNEHISYETDVPPGASAVKVEVWVKPATGHGALPANRPGVTVWLYDSDAKTCALLASASASAVTLGAYEVRTLLTATAAANTVAVPAKIIVRVVGESGANYASGLSVDEPTVTFTTPKMNYP